MILLYGPRQFGTSTIAYGIADWLGDDVKCLIFDLNRMDVVEEKIFWKRLGMWLDVNRECSDDESFMQLVIDCTTREKKRFCLIMDRMHHLFTNTELAKRFLGVLRKWETASHFYGFLGIGSHELVHHHKIFYGGNDTSPFNEDNMIKIEPFSLDQINAFFQLLKPRYDFSPSLQHGIMTYSRGAPGVFGSMIQFATDNNKWTSEWKAWEVWFNQGAFSVYLQMYNVTYHHTQWELEGLTEGAD